MRIIMRLYQWRDIWYVEIRVDDKKQRRSLRTRNKTFARRLFNQIKKDHLAGKVRQLTGKCTVTLGQFQDEFLEWAERAQGIKTFKANRLALYKLIHVTGETILLDRISLKHIDEMVAQGKDKDLSVNSINNYIRHVRATLNKAVEWGHVQVNPLARAKELPRDRKPPQYLDRQQVAYFLADIENVDLRRFVVASLATGRRRSELWRLEWKDIDFKNDRYIIRKSKNHLSRWYPLPSMFRAVLEACGPGKGQVFKQWGHPDTLTHQVKKALINAGFGNLRLHDFRHTYATLQIMSGTDLKTVQELLGHTDFKTTEIYAHLTDEHLRKAAEIYLGPVDLGNSK